MKNPAVLYWCSTPSGEEDGWVVSRSWARAIAYFGFKYSVPLEVVSAEVVCPVPNAACAGRMDEFEPSMGLLEYLNIQWNKNFHVFHLGSRIFRPPTFVRELLATR